MLKIQRAIDSKTNDQGGMNHSDRVIMMKAVGARHTRMCWLSAQSNVIHGIAKGQYRPHAVSNVDKAMDVQSATLRMAARDANPNARITSFTTTKYP